GLRAGSGLDKSSRFTRDGAVDAALDIRPNAPIHNPLPDFMLGATIFWQLDIWRELRNARDAAVQRYAAAVERRNDFVTRLVSDVAEEYYNLLALDQRLSTLDLTIALQEESLKVAQALFNAARVTELPVQRFRAEIRKNQGERLAVRQEVVEAENRLNLLSGRFPQPVARGGGTFAAYLDLSISALNAGLPAQLLANRPDVRRAERELAAAGLDVKAARARFFPRLDLSAGVGYRSFNPKYLFNTPQALIANVAGDLAAPLVNRAAIQAEYLTASAQQLQAVYAYQRVVLTAFGEVVTRLAQADNFRRGVEVRRQQLAALESSVEVASKLFQNARAEYIEVLLAQRDLLEARTALIDAKRRQLAAVVNAYQALGGGTSLSLPTDLPPPHPHKGK
ncbi:MAG: TolC family protein, partial [Gemmataceae bacterium]|nr:TolC family protein [Gemmataceae bacterium]